MNHDRSSRATHVESLEARKLLSAVTHGLTGEYFTGDDFQTPTVVRTDTKLNFNWRRFNAPDVLLVGKTFSAQLSGTLTPTVTGTYTFSLPSNSGTRLLIDGTTVIDNFTARDGVTPTGSIALTAGASYSIEAQYVSGGTQRDFFSVKWSTAGIKTQVIPTADLTPNTAVALPSNEALIGTYYAGPNFNTEVLTRADPDINYNFPFGEPDPAIPEHSAFSAVWVGTVLPSYTETYSFSARTDDGVRVFVNGTEIINRFHDQSTATSRGSVALTAGVAATVRVEYYENGVGSADAHLFWQSASQAKQVVPFSVLALAAPTNLTAVAASDTEITLNWTASPNATGYVIEQSTNGGAFTPITSVGPTPTQYTVGGLTAGTPYSFEVVATGSGVGNSAPSNAASASTEAALPGFSSLTTIYGLGASNVYSINTSTGVQTQIGTLSFNTDSGARSPASGTFYYLSTDPANVQVSTWDPSTGVNTVISGTYPVSGAVERAAFRSDNTLFFTDGINTLHTFNTNSLAAPAIGIIESGGTVVPGSTGDIAFDPSGNLFLQTNDTLYEVTAANLAPAVLSGTATTVIPATDIGPTTGATGLQLAFGQNGILFGTATNGSLFTINTTTGAATQVGTATGTQQGDLASVPAYADLAVAQTATTLTAGQNATYTFSVTNAGPQATPGPTTITDVLPTGLTFVSGAGNGWTFNVTGSTVTAIYTGVITNGGVVPAVSITVAVATSAPSSISNTVVIASSIFDSNTANNTNTLVSTVTV